MSAHEITIRRITICVGPTGAGWPLYLEDSKRDYI